MSILNVKEVEGSMILGSKKISWIARNPVKNLQSINSFVDHKVNKDTSKDLFVKYNSRIVHISLKNFYALNNLFYDSHFFENLELLHIDLSSMQWENEQKVLCYLALSISAKNIFEIGTCYGLTSSNLACLLPDASVVTIDNQDYKKHSYFCRFNDLIDYNKVKKVICDSTSFDFKPYHNKIDVFYVDGSHSYKNVKSDGINALKCVKNNGFIVFHDFYNNCGYDGLVKAICEISDEYDKRMYWIEGTRFCIMKGFSNKSKIQ